MPRYTLDDYLSQDEALAYLKSIGHETAEGTFANHIHVAGHIKPIPLGERVHRQTGEVSAITLAFTRRMLDQYAAGNWPVEPTEAEIDGIIDLKQLGAMAGLGRSAVKKRVFVLKQIPYKTIGRVSVVLRREAEKFVENATFYGKGKGE